MILLLSFSFFFLILSCLIPTFAIKVISGKFTTTVHVLLLYIHTGRRLKGNEGEDTLFLCSVHIHVEALYRWIIKFPFSCTVITFFFVFFYGLHICFFERLTLKSGLSYSDVLSSCGCNSMLWRRRRYRSTRERVFPSIHTRAAPHIPLPTLSVLLSVSSLWSWTLSKTLHHILFWFLKYL